MPVKIAHEVNRNKRFESMLQRVRYEFHSNRTEECQGQPYIWIFLFSFQAGMEETFVKVFGSRPC